MHAYAGLDTETSGLPDKTIPDEENNGFRLASLSIVRASPTWATQSEETYYVKPDGWTMQPDATAVNGLTDEFLQEHGAPIEAVLDAFCAAVREGRVICGHNVAFDIRIVRAELKRAGRDQMIAETLTLCSMLRSIGVVRSRQADGVRMKTPTLTELLAHFKIPHRNAHTSLGDAISCLKGLQMLASIGIRLEPQAIKERVFKVPKEPKDGGKKEGKRRPQGDDTAQANWLRPETLK